MAILINVVLPVFLVAGIGAFAQPRLRLDVRSISRIVFYLFSPALVLDALVRSGISSGEFGRIAVAVLSVILMLWALSEIAARLLRLSGPMQSAFLTAILLMNAGNYGLPVTLFAFGETGLARASLYFTVSAATSSSLGVYLAARGRAPARAALRRVATVPLVYAAALGLMLNLTGLTLPEPLLKAIHLLGQAAVPAMLIVLGIQLTQTFQDGWHKLHLPALAVVVVGRLLVAPALALLVTRGLGLHGVTRNVVVLESAMPTAVITTILATEFESDAAFVTLSVFVTTMASLFTITALLSWMLHPGAVP